jgi:hypothetical protein
MKDVCSDTRCKSVEEQWVARYPRSNTAVITLRSSGESVQRGCVPSSRLMMPEPTVLYIHKITSPDRRLAELNRPQIPQRCPRRG